MYKYGICNILITLAININTHAKIHEMRGTVIGNQGSYSSQAKFLANQLLPNLHIGIIYYSWAGGGDFARKKKIA